MAGELLSIKRDPYRQPLDDLDPVAGRILRRDQGEGRAGAAGKTDDAAVEHGLAAIEIADQGCRLARTDPRELALLEVGVDIDRAHRDDGHHGIAGGDPLT